MAKGIKRIVVLSMMAVMACNAAVGQNVYEGSTPLMVINQDWEQVTLSGASDGSLIGMLDCFNKKWPTWMVEHAIKTMKKGQRLERYGEGLPTVFYDSKNGWVDVAASPMGSMEQTDKLLYGQTINYSGWLHSNEYRRNALADNVTAQVIRDEKRNLFLHINQTPFAQWFKEQFGIGQEQRRGLRR